MTGVFKSCRKMEAEVASMVRHMLHGGDESSGMFAVRVKSVDCCECLQPGTLASGGTEAILLAVLAHRCMIWAYAITYAYVT